MRRNSYVPNKMWAGALGIWRVMSKKKNTKKGWSAPWLGSCTCKLSHVSCSWLYCIAITETCYFCAVNAPMFSAKKSTSTVIAPDLLVALKKKKLVNTSSDASLIIRGSAVHTHNYCSHTPHVDMHAPQHRRPYTTHQTQPSKMVLCSQQ